MRGLVPRIHVLRAAAKAMAGTSLDKPGHDDTLILTQIIGPSRSESPTKIAKDVIAITAEETALCEMCEKVHTLDATRTQESCAVFREDHEHGNDTRSRRKHYALGRSAR